MTDRELMQQALDALEKIGMGGDPRWADDVAPTLRARLAQPEQEPVAWYEPESYSNVTIHKKWAKENGWLPLYTAPPQREWQGLTDEERTYLAWESNNGPHCVAMTEAKLKDKNG